MDAEFGAAASGAARQSRQSLPVHPPLQQQDTLCEVEGRPARCLVLEGSGPMGTYRSYIGASGHKGQGLIIACVHQVRDGSEPPLCQGIFKL